MESPSSAGGYLRATEHLVVANCILRTSCNGFKFGTEAEGNLRNVSVTNCVISKRDSGRRPLAGVALESVDGAHVDDIVISNLSIEDALAPIFIRVGNRGRGMASPAPGSITNVSIRNIVATGASIASSITAVKGGRIQNIEIDGLNVTAQGGGVFVSLDVPERAASYPDADMFGKLPAVALYARGAEGFSIRSLTLSSNAADGRPAIVLDEVTQLTLSELQTSFSPQGQSLLAFRNVAGALLYGNRWSSSASFLSLSGERTKAIALRSNDLTGVPHVFVSAADVPSYEVSVDAACEPSRLN